MLTKFGLNVPLLNLDLNLLSHPLTITPYWGRASWAFRISGEQYNSRAFQLSTIKFHLLPYSILTLILRLALSWWAKIRDYFLPEKSPTILDSLNIINYLIGSTTPYWTIRLIIDDYKAFLNHFQPQKISRVLWRELFC